MYMRPEVRLMKGKNDRRFLRPFGRGYKYNFRKPSRNRMRTSDTAFESRKSMFLNEKIFDVLKEAIFLGAEMNFLTK